MPTLSSHAPTPGFRSELQDVTFESARSNCCALEDLTANLEAQFKNEIVRLTHYSQAVQSTASLFKSFYDDQNNLDRMSGPAALLEANQLRLTGSNILKVAGTIDVGLIAPVVRFRQTLVAAKEEVKVRCEAKERYQHYQNKLTELRQEHEKTQSKGKIVAPKDIDRLKRNEIKHEKAKVVYEAMNVRVVAVLEHLNSTRFTHLDPVFQTYVDLQSMLHDRLSKEALTVRNALQAALEKPVRAPMPASSVPPMPDIAAIENGVTTVGASAASGSLAAKPDEGKWERVVETDEQDPDITLVNRKGRSDTEADVDDIVPPSRSIHPNQ